MKVQDRSLIGSAASGASEAQRIDREGGTAASTSRNGGGDHVTLSGLADRISQHFESAAAARQERINALAQQYSSGKLRFDPAEVGRAMIENALSAHAA